MRISDWSSDVCSSDLSARAGSASFWISSQRSRSSSCEVDGVEPPPLPRPPTSTFAAAKFISPSTPLFDCNLYAPTSTHRHAHRRQCLPLPGFERRVAAMVAGGLPRERHFVTHPLRDRKSTRLNSSH